MMRLFFYILIFLQIHTFTFSQSKKIEITEFIDKVIRVDSSTIRKNLSLYSSKFIEVEKDVFYYPDLGIRYWLQYDRVDRVFFEKLSNFTLKGKILSKKINFEDLNSIYKIDNYAFAYNYLEKNKNKTIIRIESEDNDKNLWIYFKYKSPKPLFHSDIASQGYSVPIGKVDKVVPSSLELVEIIVRDIIPPIPGFFKYDGTTPQKIYNHFRENNYEMAIKELDTIINEDPNNYEAIQLKVSALTTLDRFQEAVKISENLIKLKDGNTSSNYLNLLELYLLNNQLEEAIEFRNKYKNQKSQIDESVQNRLLWEFYGYTAEYLLGKSNTKQFENIRELLPYINFQYFRWSFEKFKVWLKNHPNFEEKQKSFIETIIKEIENTKK